jgi:ion channel-forming bestrophin family protein
MPFSDVLSPLTTSKTLIKVSLAACMVGVYSLLAIAKEFSAFRQIASLPSDVHAALSLVLGCLLVFRTNTAYNRWWEARTLWGGLINACRNIATKLRRLSRLSKNDLEDSRILLSAFPFALKDHLRGEQTASHMHLINSHADRPANHLPLAIVQRLYRILGCAKASGTVDGDELRVIDWEMSKLLDICGACERIQRTRIVASYRIFARQCIVLVLATFPWGVARDFGWWTLPLSIIVAYFMIGLEVVAEHVEEPFGYDEDDLDLEGMCKTIATSMEQVFGEDTV